MSLITPNQPLLSSSLNGLVVVLTGGAQGVGQSVVQQLHCTPPTSPKQLSIPFKLTPNSRWCKNHLRRHRRHTRHKAHLSPKQQRHRGKRTSALRPLRHLQLRPPTHFVSNSVQPLQPHRHRNRQRRNRNPQRPICRCARVQRRNSLSAQSR